MHTHTHTHRQTHTHTHTRTYTRTYTRTHTHTSAHTLTLTHTHTQSHPGCVPLGFELRDFLLFLQQLLSTHIQLLGKRGKFLQRNTHTDTHAFQMSDNDTLQTRSQNQPRVKTKLPQ